MTKVKICGLKKLEHALIATETGASFLGFVFVEGVRRKISPFDANELITGLKERYTGDFPKLVGLFANQASSYVNQVVSQCDLDIVQLCGDEGPEYWSSINCSIIKQVKMDSEGKGRDELSHIKSQVDDITEAGLTPLLDSYEKNYEFDFSKATIRKFSKYKNIIIIGMGGSILGTKSIYSYLEKKVKKKVFFFDNLD